jgi:hypothetical protein
MGYHFYHFYENDEKLAKALADFFMEGLRKSEYCMWVPREGITHDRAIILLKSHMSNIEDYLLRDQMRIETFENWYITKNRKLDVDKMLEKWKDKYNDVMESGFISMRVTGDLSSISKESWNDIMTYEAKANEIINKLNIVAVCTYKGILYKPSEIQMILRNHFCPLAPCS